MVAEPPMVASETPVPGQPSLPTVPPGPWSGPGFLAQVPPGWSGVEGPPPRLLSLTERSTGFMVEFWAGEGVRTVEGQSCHFEQRGAFRSLPLFDHPLVASCSDDAQVRQLWTGLVAGSSLQVETTYPQGQAVLGRQAVAGILRGLTLAR